MIRNFWAFVKSDFCGGQKLLTHPVILINQNATPLNRGEFFFPSFQRRGYRGGYLLFAVRMPFDWFSYLEEKNY